jgi:hypothetical protein
VTFQKRILTQSDVSFYIDLRCIQFAKESIEYKVVGCNRPAQNDEENLKNKTKKTIYDN